MDSQNNSASGKVAMSKIHDERRKSQRYQCDCDAKWSYFNKEGELDAQISNVGDNGCYLQIDRPMTPGATITLRVVQHRGTECKFPHINTVAEVKWCRLIDKGSRPFYAAGVRYHYPV